MTNGHQRLISKPEIQFWFPIIATVVTITIWGMTLSGQINVISTKIEAFETRIVNLEEKDIRFAQVLNEWSKRLVRVETKIE